MQDPSSKKTTPPKMNVYGIADVFCCTHDFMVIHLNHVCSRTLLSKVGSMHTCHIEDFFICQGQNINRD